MGQVVRLIRLLRFSNSAKRMLALVTHVVPNAVRLLAIIASALYFYSVVGMESFAGCLSNRTLVAKVCVCLLLFFFVFAFFAFYLSLFFLFRVILISLFSFSN